MHKSLQLLDQLIYKLETNLGLPHKEFHSPSVPHPHPPSSSSSEEKKEQHKPTPSK